jgi:hypothetical protein
MPNVRLHPPIFPVQQQLVVHGRRYSGTPGTPVDVPDFDAGPLEANGWTRVAEVGPTTARPRYRADGQPLLRGQTYLDTTLGAIVQWDGASWRNASGAAV